MSLTQIQGTEVLDYECVKVSASVWPHCALFNMSVKHKYLFYTSSVMASYFHICMYQISACIVKQLETAGFFSDSTPKTKLFVTIHDAVLHILKKQSQADLVLVSLLLLIFFTFLKSLIFINWQWCIWSAMFLHSCLKFSSFFQDGTSNTKMWPAGFRLSLSYSCSFSRLLALSQPQPSTPLPTSLI